MARGEYIVAMDDDLQNPPDEIPKLLTHIKQHGVDLVYGCPSKRTHLAWRNLEATIFWHFYRPFFATLSLKRHFALCGIFWRKALYFMIFTLPIWMGCWLGVPAAWLGVKALDISVGKCIGAVVQKLRP